MRLLVNEIAFGNKIISSFAIKDWSFLYLTKPLNIFSLGLCWFAFGSKLLYQLGDIFLSLLWSLAFKTSLRLTMMSLLFLFLERHESLDWLSVIYLARLNLSDLNFFSTLYKGKSQGDSWSKSENGLYIRESRQQGKFGFKSFCKEYKCEILTVGLILIITLKARQKIDELSR